MSESSRRFSRRSFLLKAIGIAAVGGISLIGLDLLLSRPASPSSVTSSHETQTQSQTQPTSSQTTPRTTSTVSSTQSSETTGSGSSSQTTTSQSSVSNNIPWSGLRGICYKWNSLTLSPDGATAPDPATSFPILQSLGFNLARIDNMDWNYMEKNQSAFLSLVQQVLNAADSQGISCVWHFGGPQNGNVYPRDVTGAFPSGTFVSNWWQNAVIPSGTYAGMTCWEAFFQGFWKPLIQVVDSHPCTIAYAPCNEPSGLPSNPDQVLHNFYQYLTQRIRTISSKAVAFEYSGGGAGGVGGEGDIVAVSPTADLYPVVFEGHYPSSTEFASWAQGCAKLGIPGWVGEWHISDIQNLNGLQLCRQYGFANTVYVWACNGDLLSSTCQETSTAQWLSQQDNSILGQAEFF